MLVSQTKTSALILPNLFSWLINSFVSIVDLFDVWMMFMARTKLHVVFL